MKKEKIYKEIMEDPNVHPLAKKFMVEQKNQEDKRKAEENCLAFEIFDVFNNEKVNIRKIYLDGHIEGFEGDPCIVNHAYPKFMQLRGIIIDMLRQMNNDYRDLITKHTLADLPINLTELSKFYQAQLERIINIKI